MTTSLVHDTAGDPAVHEGPGNRHGSDRRQMAADAVRCTCHGASSALPQCKEPAGQAGMCAMCLDHCAPLSRRVAQLMAPRLGR